MSTGEEESSSDSDQDSSYAGQVAVQSQDWKPTRSLIEHVFVTDVTANLVTVTVKESPTSVGFFSIRNCWFDCKPEQTEWIQVLRQLEKHTREWMNEWVGQFVLYLFVVNDRLWGIKKSFIDSNYLFAHVKKQKQKTSNLIKILSPCERFIKITFSCELK